MALWHAQREKPKRCALFPIPPSSKLEMPLDAALDAREHTFDISVFEQI